MAAIRATVGTGAVHPIKIARRSTRLQGQICTPKHMRRELAGLERHVRQLAHEDPVCLRLMSMPGIGAVVALTYQSAVDDPIRFTSSEKVGP